MDCATGRPRAPRVAPAMAKSHGSGRQPCHWPAKPGIRRAVHQRAVAVNARGWRGLAPEGRREEGVSCGIQDPGMALAAGIRSGFRHLLTHSDGVRPLAPCGRILRKIGVGQPSGSRSLQGYSSTPVESGPMNTTESDVLILGGGVIGLCCAHYLLATGRHVTVLDQGRVGSGSSHGNCGTLTPSHAMPLAMPGVIGTALKWLMRSDAPLRIKPRLDPALMRWMANFARRCNWKDFSATSAIKAPFLVRSCALIAELVEREGLDCEYQQSGTLYVYRDSRELAASDWYVKALAAVGIVAEQLEGGQIEALEPALKPGVAGGYLNPGDARLRPDRYVAELARIVRDRGGSIHEGTRIESIERTGARVSRVRTNQGDFTARDVVFALGAWSPAMGRQLGLRLPIQPGKGYSITYTRPGICPRIPVVLKEASVCVTSWESGYRLGSTMEFAGYDTSLNRTRLDALRRAAANYLREPEGSETLEEWYGWRPMTPDDLPIIGGVPGLENLCMATGHGMLGVSMSALTGLLVSEYLGGGPTSLDLAPFSVARFR